MPSSREAMSERKEDGKSERALIIFQKIAFVYFYDLCFNIAKL